jgi:polyisoprenoid-binding protein YceI
MKTQNFTSRLNLIPALFAAILFFALPLISQAQTYGLVSGKQGSIKVLGTSNVHDWEMASTSMDSKGEFKFDGNNALQSISNFTFTVAAKTIKSESSSMDSRMYKAIKADEYPKITYNLRSTQVTPAGKNKFLVKAIGDLTIAGAKQPIAMDVNVVVNPDNTLTITGSEPLKLTDYKLTPPSFMAGAMKVGNDLTIKYALNYKK